MSLALYISVNDEKLQEEIFVNGKMIARNQKVLEAIGEEYKLPKFEKYYCQSKEEAREFLMDSGLSEDEIPDLPDEKWYCPTEGLQLTLGYQDLLEKETDWGDKKETPLIREELKEYEAVFRKLIDLNKLWHFSYDF